MPSARSRLKQLDLRLGLRGVVLDARDSWLAFGLDGGRFAGVRRLLAREHHRRRDLRGFERRDELTFGIPA